jgi:hypothetical protein
MRLSIGPRAVPARSAQKYARVLGRPERPEAVGAAASRDGSRSAEPGAALPPRHISRGNDGYLLIEVLVYIAVVLALLGAGYAAMYRCLDSSIALRRNADDITSALHAGERWRADLRSATGRVSVDDTDAGQLLHLDTSRGQIVYQFHTNAVFRSVGPGPWVRLLPNVKSSTMTADPREHVTAWRWELELQPRQSGSVKPGRVRPLFTFTAVPKRTPTK